MSTSHRFVVTDERVGERLDQCLANLSTAWTRSRVRRLIDAGRVLHNGVPGKPATLVAVGDSIEVDEPELEPAAASPEPIPLDILLEDEHLLVLNKPAGLVIHPAAGNPTGTLVNALLHHCTDLSGIGGVERPGIVHRLDKNTTGALVVAKTDTAHLALSLAFRRRQVDKSYLAVCYGVPSQHQGTIDAPIGRHPKDRQRMAVTKTGRNARTKYRVEESFSGTALVRCHLITGRTHQIRVHLAHIGHALVGDPLYAGRQWRNLENPALVAMCRSYPRQALHAERIAFVHPASGEKVEVTARLPKDLDQLIRVLRKNS